MNDPKVESFLIGLRWKHKSQTKTVSLRSLNGVWCVLAILFIMFLTAGLTNGVYLLTALYAMDRTV